MTTSALPPHDSAASEFPRRTILAGAAWTIPVVAVAAATPAHAASATYALAFDKTSYSGTACGTITGAYVTLTQGGSGVGNKSIVVTLDTGGYTFAGGNTSYTGVTDSTGKLTLPAISVPAIGGTATTSAVAVDASTTATLVSPSEALAYQYVDGGATNQQDKVPAGSTAIGDTTFLAPNGDLFFKNKTIATGVTSADFQFIADNTCVITYMNSSGGHKYVSASNATLDYAAPSDSKAIGDMCFLAPNGDLYWANMKKPLASGVTSANFQFINDNTNVITWVTATGGHKYESRGGSFFTYTLPSGCEAIGDMCFLAPNGDLYWANTTKPLATGVTSANFQFINDNTNVITWTTTSGGRKWESRGQKFYSYTIPTGSIAVGDVCFLAPNGDLYWFYATNPIAKNVATVNFQFVNDNKVRINYTSAPACKP